MKNRTVIKKISFILVWGVSIIIILALSTFFIMREIGKKQLTVSGNDISIFDSGNTDIKLSDNQIFYNGNVYEMIQDLIVILVMGIDKETVSAVGGQSWSAEKGTEYAGGQADALFLVIINPRDKKADIVAINRNSMVDVDVWDENGNYKGVFTKQIALQHGYGDGGIESCERQVKAVSRMFHNILISSYVAVSMDVIPKLNDAVGGIEVEVLDDIIYPEYDMELHQGDIVMLQGEKAYWYVRLRNENVFNSNELRLQRQKQYITNFLEVAKKQVMKDIKVAISLYQTVQEYMVTDIDLNSFIYMATELLDYNININNIYTVQGEAVQGNNFEEFYVDEEALQELIVKLFYEQTDK